jgi:hypothetical protein
MRPLNVRLVLCFALSLGPACLFESASSSKKFSETVEQMNKATRWGQLGQAARMVDPAYRAQFTSNHAGWGELIQVADAEVVQLDMAPTNDSATAVISYEWYLKSAMTLHQSVVRQRWSRGRGGFGLLSEIVVQGDPRLLGGKGAPVRPPGG